MWKKKSLTPQHEIHRIYFGLFRAKYFALKFIIIFCGRFVLSSYSSLSNRIRFFFWVNKSRRLSCKHTLSLFMMKPKRVFGYYWTCNMHCLQIPEVLQTQQTMWLEKLKRIYIEFDCDVPKI